MLRPYCQRHHTLQKRDTEKSSRNCPGSYLPCWLAPTLPGGLCRLWEKLSAHSAVEPVCHTTGQASLVPINATEAGLLGMTSCLLVACESYLVMKNLVKSLGQRRSWTSVGKLLLVFCWTAAMCPLHFRLKNSVT